MKSEGTGDPPIVSRGRRTIIENRNWKPFVVVFEPTTFEVVLRPGTALLVEFTNGELDAISFDGDVAYVYCFAERAILQDLQGHALEVVFDLTRASGSRGSDSQSGTTK